MKPISVHALAALLGSQHTDHRLITGAHIDSRLISEGDVFFALPGVRVNGHDFLSMASEKKAVAAVVTESYRGPDFGMALIRVPDVLLSLQELAKKKVQEASYKVVAITGSIGKTTTKEFAKTLLEGHYKLYASPKSYNSRITLPLNILMSNGDEDILLLEMGMTEPGEIKKLVNIAPPNVALITTVSLQHATSFPEGLSSIAQEKASIFSHPKTELALFHHDMPYALYARQMGHATKKTFSLKDKEADYFFDEIDNFLPHHFLHKPHKHNFLAAVALAHSLGLTFSQIKERIPLLRPPPLRFEQIEKEGIIFINDAYNANPEALVAAFASLPTPKTGRKKIGVISEMDALGSFTEEAHLMVGAAAFAHLDALFCIGSHCLVMRSLWKDKSFAYFENKETLLLALEKLAQPGDVVLLKGARKYALDELLLKFHPR